MTEWASLSWTSINRSGGAEWLTCSLYTCDRHKLKHYLLYKSIAQCQYTESLQNHYNDIHVPYISTVWWYYMYIPIPIYLEVIS